MFTFSASPGWFEGDSYTRYAEAGKRGFVAMEELGWKHLDLQRVRAVIDETGVKPSALLFQSKDEQKHALIANDHGIVHEDAHDAFVDAIRETLDAALIMGAPNIVVTTGNERADVSRYVQHTNIVTALRRAVPIVEGTGVTIVLEPLNILVNHKGYYLTTTAEAAEIIDAVGSPSVRILYDVYHQQITEGNVIANIRQYIDKIGHIHLGDVPGRKQPGTGELNYRNIFKAIAETGYDKYATFECGCTIDRDEACRQMFALLEGW